MITKDFHIHRDWKETEHKLGLIQTDQVKKKASDQPKSKFECFFHPHHKLVEKSRWNWRAIRLAAARPGDTRY